MVVNLDITVGRARLKKVITDEDRAPFKTIGFDPRELLTLKELSEEDLLYLMAFCGVKAFNGLPVMVLDADEMRMAYLIWRADMIATRQGEVKRSIEKGTRWVNYAKTVLEVLSK